ncbi:MAG: transcription repressor NadR [Lachnospiraceae bacterium]|nr:transcription repressor NadR [Lachnospiraceae bacterium]
MNNVERREQIIQILKNTQIPVSGSRLASLLGVSRQVIVQDIALLRTQMSILATAQGYLIYTPAKEPCRRSFLVRHSSEQIFDELTTIVSAGGHVIDVIVEHDVYGQITADLNLRTLQDVERFCGLLAQSTSGPLFPISAGIHLHTVEADSAVVLDEIELALKQKGYLIP